MVLANWQSRRRPGQGPSQGRDEPFWDAGGRTLEATRCSAPQRAEAKIRDVLGALGEGASISWDLGPETVAVTVRVSRPGILRPFGTGSIERTVRVRREVLQ